MSILSSNNIDLASISVKGLHNRSIKLLKSISEESLPPFVALHFMERQEKDKWILKSMFISIPKNIMDNPELTDENIQVMKKYLYHRFVDTGIPLKNLDAMSDPIKEKDYIL